MRGKFTKDYWIIRLSGLFDKAYYLKQYPDVRRADIDPIEHYVLYGWEEGRNPTPWFDTNAYLESNPDVTQAGINPFVHWIKIKGREKNTHIAHLEGVVRKREAIIHQIYSGHGWKWKLLTKYFKIRDKILPVNSRRRRAAKFVRNFVWNIFQNRNIFQNKRFKRKRGSYEKGIVKFPEVGQLSTRQISSLDEDLMKSLKIAFVSQPEYFRFIYEALDRDYDVKEFILKWNGHIEDYSELIDFNPHITFFFRPELYPDELLEVLSGIKVALSSEPIPKYINNRLITSNDMKQRFESLKGAINKKYDYFFHYDKTSLRFLQENMFKVSGEFYFPVDTRIYRPYDRSKEWDWGFFGRSTPHREKFLGIPKRDLKGLHIAHGVYGELFVELMNACRIGLNLHVDENISLEPRVQMMMACKIMVLSEPLSCNHIIKPGIHYVEFSHPEELWGKLKYYLKHDVERERIALNGFKLIRDQLSSSLVFKNLISKILNENISRLRELGLVTVRKYKERLLKLDLGCGKYKRDGFIGVDKEKFDGVDIVHDLNEPLPFPDNSTEMIYCSHTLEHVKDPIFLLEEMYRVCIADAVIEIIVPLHEPDPTHVTIFDENWFANNLDQEKFSIISSKIERKSSISPAELKHSYIEQQIVLKVLKKKTSHADTVKVSFNLPDLSENSVNSLVAKESQRTNYKIVAKPSIAFIIPSQSLSGGIMVICQHANRLIKKGYKVVLIDSKLDDRFKLLDWLPNLLPEVIPIERARRKIDIVFATHWSTAYIVRDFPACRKLYFVQSDETRFNPPGSKESELARQTYTFDMEFVVVAKWLWKWLKDKFGKKAHYVSNGVDSAVFYPDRPLEPRNNKIRVLLEGPISVPFKGMKEAFEVVNGMDCEVWCVSTSGWPEPNWKCNKFFQYVPHEKMRHIYSSCDVLIKMSKVEGFFLPPLEMMACGGTVITSKVTGYDEYIVDGYNGMVVEQGDVRSAKQKLQQLINDTNLLNNLKKAGLETAKEWTWEYSNDQLEKIISGKA